MVPTYSCRLLALSTLCITSTLAQTFSSCNPLTSGNCPPVPALGKSAKFDFSSESSEFTAQGSPTYTSEGASLTVRQAGDAPQLNSKHYIMFGYVEFVIKVAPGAGIVSSAVLQSDDLDEIDWEWLGGDNAQAQSNYFGKGQTLTYNRGAFHPAPGNHDGFKTYGIDWTADQIVWSIDGQTVRTLSSTTASQYPYPQTPMMIKAGAWCGGCAGNAPGTIEWAGGAPNLGSGGSTMIVKSISATDYSTGSEYTYTGTDGTWQSIKAVNGAVHSTGSKGSSAPADNKPSVVNTQQVNKANGAAVVASPAATTISAATNTATTYPGLPEGWTVASSGKVLPPSAAPITTPASLPSSAPLISPQGSAGGSFEIITAYDGQGFPVAITQAANGPPRQNKYDDKGFLIIPRAIETSSEPTGIFKDTSAVSTTLPRKQRIRGMSVKGADGSARSEKHLLPRSSAGRLASPKNSMLGLLLVGVIRALL